MGGTITSKETELKDTAVSSPEYLRNVFLAGFGNFNLVQCNFQGMAVAAMEKHTKFDWSQQTTMQRYLNESDLAFKDNFVRVYDFHSVNNWVAILNRAKLRRRSIL